MLIFGALPSTKRKLGKLTMSDRKIICCKGKPYVLVTQMRKNMGKTGKKLIGSESI